MCVEPLADEIFSSWIERTALEYLAAPHTFARIVFDSRAVWNRDIDKSGTVDMAHALARPMAIDMAKAEATLLRGFEGKLVEHHNPNGNSRWLMPLGVWHRRRRLGGLQFCPLCLAEDNIPFFRKRWRLSFMTTCDIHGCALACRCPDCGCPVQYNVLPPTARTLRHCPFCGTDLADSPCRFSTPVAVVALQGMLLDAAYTGWGTHGAFGTRHALLIFPVMARILSLLLSRRKVARRFIKIATMSAGVSDIDWIEGQDFDRLLVDERNAVLAVANTLFDDWPARFNEICRSSSAGVSALLQEGATLPFWYEDHVRTHFDRQPYIETVQEFEAALAYLKRYRIPPTRSAFVRLFGKREILRKRPAWQALVRQYFPD